MDLPIQHDYYFFLNVDLDGIYPIQKVLVYSNTFAKITCLVMDFVSL